MGLEFIICLTTKTFRSFSVNICYVVMVMGHYYRWYWKEAEMCMTLNPMWTVLKPHLLNKTQRGKNVLLKFVNLINKVF